MPEKKTLNEDLFYRGSSANLPRLHTCKNKVPFWDFSQFAVTVSQFQPTRFPLQTATGMCHFLPVHHLEWHFGPGRRSKYNNSSKVNSFFSIFDFYRIQEFPKERVTKYNFSIGLFFHLSVHHTLFRSMLS